MLKRLTVWGGVLAMMLALAAPAFAQAEPEETTIAGVIQPVANPTARRAYAHRYRGCNG